MMSHVPDRALQNLLIMTQNSVFFFCFFFVFCFLLGGGGGEVFCLRVVAFFPQNAFIHAGFRLNRDKFFHHVLPTFITLLEAFILLLFVINNILH